MKHIRFYFPQTADPAQLGLNEKGQKVEALMSIQLFPEGTYWAHYSERAVGERGDSGTQYFFIFEQKHIQGTWSYADKNLELSDIGYAVPAKYEALSRPYPSFKFTLLKEFHDPRAVGKVMNLVMNGSDTGPRGQYVHQFCEGQE